MKLESRIESQLFRSKRLLLALGLLWTIAIGFFLMFDWIENEEYWIALAKGEADEAVAIARKHNQIAVTGYLVLWLLGIGGITAGGNRLHKWLAFNRAMEEKLIESEERLHFVLEGSRLGIWDWNLETGLVKRNERWAEMLGYALEESPFTFERWVDLIHPEDREQARDSIHRHLEGRTDVFESEYRMRHKDGPYKWIIARAKVMERGADQRPLRMCGTLADIDERKKNERALRDKTDELLKAHQDALQTLAMMELVFINAPIGVCFHDRNMRFLNINSTFAKILQLPACEAIGHTPAQVIPQIAPRIDPILSAVLLTGEPLLNVEIAMECDPILGDRKYWQASYYPLRLPHGDILGVGAIATDITEHKKSDQAIRQAKDYAENLIETANAIVLGLDANGLIQVFNRAAERITGYAREEVLNRNWFDIMIPREIDSYVREIFSQMKDHELPKTVENPIRVKSGEERLISWRNSEITEGGKIVGCISFGLDVTDQRKAETALRNSERRFRSLFETMVEGVAIHEMIYDAAGYPIDYRIVDVNPAYERHTGFSSHQARGQLASVLYGMSEPPFLNLYEDVVRFGRPYCFESFFVALQRHFSISVVSPQEKIFATIFEDITERKKVEEKLRFTQYSIDHAAEAVFWVDRNARIIYVNEMACQNSGYTRDELLTMTVFDVDSAFSEEVWDNRWKEIIERRSFVFESSERRKDGTVFPNEVTVNYLEFDGRGYVCAFVRDISQRKMLEEQLLQSQKMEAVGKLAGGVAHDFNNLLLVISGYCAILQSEGSLGDEEKASVDEISKAAERAASLTRQLLAYSRKQVLEPQIIDINELILTMEKMLRRLIGENIELVFLPFPDAGQIKADPSQVEQVIMNLAVNARDAMPNGGTLTIETRNCVFDEEYCQSHLDVLPGEYVMAAVTDSGFGMDKETLKQIFDPFFTTKEKSKGTGLGLATVYGIVKQSGGLIFVYSEPGKGSSFKIYFPRVDAAKDSNAAVETAIESYEGTETILLVEDEDMVQTMVTRALRRRGYTVLTASQGVEAIQASREYSDVIHLLITDVILPKMSGRETANCLSADRPAMKVLYMSGYTNNAIVHHGILDEGIHFLQKPFSTEALLRKVREILCPEEKRG